jgi:enoyl-[acyl-carrier protein] reductase III
MADTKNKVALITGGSRGIGKSIALEFGNLGYHIAFNYLRNHDAAEQTRREIETLGVRCLKLRAHLAEPDQIANMFQSVAQEFSSIDVLINNAASGVQRNADELTTKHWDWAMNINARAPWLCSVEAAKLMPNGGSIVNITSEGSRKVLPYYLSVGTSKAALESLTRYLAVELAQKGINVNAVSGGYVETAALESFPNKQDMVASSKNTLAGREITGADIAKVTAFLCSEDASMIKGQIIIVDGGITLQAPLSSANS